MCIYTHNWISVMNLDNKMLDIDKKQQRKMKKKNEKKSFLLK